MEKKYLPMLSRSEPIHVLASELYGIVSNRLYVAILQKYITSARSNMPERLHLLALSAATMVLEHGMTIEQNPILSSWSWIVGALHQHHCAVLLVNEIYIVNPEPAMEQRIWRCLDYSFNLPDGLSNVEKTRMVLEELIGKAKKYSDLKRVRVPANMPQACIPRRQRAQRENRENRENREDRERSGSTQSIMSNPSPLSHSRGGNVVMQNVTPSPLAQQQSPQFETPKSTGINTFPGAMPTVDWGTFEMPASIPASSYSGIPPTNYAGNLLPGAAQQGGNNTESPNSAIYGGTGMVVGQSDGSPMDAIDDIDWVSSLFSSGAANANIKIG
jgi:hypothetical protein